MSMIFCNSRTFRINLIVITTSSYSGPDIRPKFCRPRPYLIEGAIRNHSEVDGLNRVHLAAFLFLPVVGATGTQTGRSHAILVAFDLRSDRNLAISCRRGTQGAAVLCLQCCELPGLLAFCRHRRKHRKHCQLVNVKRCDVTSRHFRSRCLAEM